MEENDDFEIDISSYQRPAFTDSFKIYLEEDKYTDVVFICKDNVKVKCHKAVLSSCSDYLKHLFYGSDQKTVCISLPDISETQLRVLLNVLYIGESVVNGQNLHELQDITDFFKISLRNTVLSTAELAHFVGLDTDEKNPDFIFLPEDLPDSKNVDYGGDPLEVFDVTSNKTLGDISHGDYTFENHAQTIVKCESVVNEEETAADVTYNIVLPNSQYVSSLCGEDDADKLICSEAVHVKRELDNGLTINKQLIGNKFHHVSSGTEVTPTCYARVKKEQVFQQNPFYQHEVNPHLKDGFTGIRISDVLSGVQAEAVAGFESDIPSEGSTFQLYHEVEDRSDFYRALAVSDDALTGHNAIYSELQLKQLCRDDVKYNCDSDTSATISAGDWAMEYEDADCIEEKDEKKPVEMMNGIYPLHPARDTDNSLLYYKSEELIQQLQKLSPTKSTTTNSLNYKLQDRTPKIKSVNKSKISNNNKNELLPRRNATAKRVIFRKRKEQPTGRICVLKDQHRNFLEEFYKSNKFPNRQTQENLAENFGVSVAAVMNWFIRKRLYANSGGQSWRGYKLIYTDGLRDALEQMYEEDKSPDVGKLLAMSEKLNLPCRFVTEWFVNRQNLDEQQGNNFDSSSSRQTKSSTNGKKKRQIVPPKKSYGHTSLAGDNFDNSSSRQTKSSTKGKEKRQIVPLKKSYGHTSLAVSLPSYYSQNNLNEADQEYLENVFQRGTVNKAVIRELCGELKVNRKVINDWFLHRQKTAAPSQHQSEIIPAENQNDSQVENDYEQDFSKPGYVTCKICGSIRYYRFVKQTKKFGIFCCEPCRKFISNLIRNVESPNVPILKCKQGSGTCNIQNVDRKQNGKITKNKSNRCQACWLKLCLNTFHMKDELRIRLLQYLPPELGGKIDLTQGKTSANEVSSIKTALRPIKYFKIRNIKCKANDCVVNHDIDAVRRRRIKNMKRAKLIRKAAMNLSKAKAKQEKLPQPVTMGCSVRLIPLKNPERFMPQIVATSSESSSPDATVGEERSRRRTINRPVWKHLRLTKKYTSKTSNKQKKKRQALRYNEQQQHTLEKSYALNRFPTEEIKLKLAEELNLSVERVTSWFRNRRYKYDKSYRGYKVIFNDALEEALESLYKSNKLTDEEEQWKFAESLSLPRFYLLQWLKKRQLRDETGAELPKEV